MDIYEEPIHIVSAHISELKMTLAQETVAGKSNEIPAMQNLIKSFEIEGYMVVADALNYQIDTAQAIIEKKADYLLCAKENQPAEISVQSNCSIMPVRNGRLKQYTGF